MSKYKNKFSVIILSCDNYFSLIPNFLKLYNKNFPYDDLDVYIVSESSEIAGFENYKFVKKSNKFWSKRLKETLVDIKTEYVLIFNDDYWIFKEINQNLIGELFDFVLEKKVDFVDYIEDPNLTDKYNLSKINNHSSLDFYRLTPNKKYAYIVNAHYIYKREFLINILQENESPWEFENFASFRVKKIFTKKYYNIFRFTWKYNPLFFERGGIIMKGKLRYGLLEKINSIDSDFTWQEKPNSRSTDNQNIFHKIIKKIKWISKKHINYFRFYLNDKVKSKFK